MVTLLKKWSCLSAVRSRVLVVPPHGYTVKNRSCLSAVRKVVLVVLHMVTLLKACLV